MRRRVNISCDIGSTVGKPCDPSASIVTLPTQTNGWTDAKVPVRRSAKTLLSVLALLFSSASLFSPRPRPALFCSLAFLTTFFSPLSRLLLLIFSHLLPLLPPLLAAVSCSTCLPHQESLVCHFCSPEEILEV